MLKSIKLFQKRDDYILFFSFILFISAYSILIEFNNYKNFTKFNSTIVNATVLKSYFKNNRQVVKFKTDNGVTFYTIVSKKTELKFAQKVKLEIWFKDITFYKYLTNFFAYAKVLNIEKDLTPRAKMAQMLQNLHKDKDISAIYEAIFLAKPLPQKLQTTFSKLGISHIVAISGFHLGILTAILFFLLKYPYSIVQNRFFPYRSVNIDIFIIILIILLIYTIFLDYPASLLRAYGMLFIGYIFYNRAIKVVSFETLFITAILLIAIYPRLLFSLGFWLSVCGVFFIFLFLIIFKKRSKLFQTIFLPFWIYITMLPISLAIFQNFSYLHPLSILWSSLFTIFYPLSIFLHIIGTADLLDFLLKELIDLGS